MDDTIGYIYILTNPSFPDFVKIGYADNVDERLRQLNQSECIPFAFRIYATYEVNVRLADKQVHKIIDTIDSQLRSSEEYNGRLRVREFYAISPEAAYSILEAMANIHGREDKLHKMLPSEIEQLEEKEAEQIIDRQRERLANFKFSFCDIHPGDTVEYCNKGNEKDGSTFVVVDDNHVDYEGQPITLSKLVSNLMNNKWSSVAGPRYFKYNGERLNDIRERLNIG